jgi:phosphoribosyl 1,2-cyclic phosphodiesterase
MMEINFYGVRGSLPCASPEYMRYGGNTSCVSIRAGDAPMLICDAGSGLRFLGEQWPENLLEGHLLISHTHHDHVLGLPFFKPLYRSNFTLSLHGGHLGDKDGLTNALNQLLAPPFFPIGVDGFKGSLDIQPITVGKPLAIPPYTIHTFALNHPGGSTAYRIEYQGKSCCYVTDTEHALDILDTALVDFIRHADVFIYDSTYDDRDFPKFKGWGHSTWQEAIRLGEAALVKQTVLFHHDIHATDSILKEREQVIAMMTLKTEVVMARDGMVLRIE